MYEGTNPTALRSRQWIMEALINMMKEKPYAAITVRDLCSRADVSRQTFYNLFDSKEEILHAYLRSEVEKVYSGLREAGQPQLGDMVEAFTQVLESNRENLQLMTDQGLGSIIAEEIAAAVSIFAGSFVEKKGGDGGSEGGDGGSEAGNGGSEGGEGGSEGGDGGSEGRNGESEGEDRGSGKEMRYAKAFLSGGLAQTLLLWTREDTPLAGDELTRILAKILQGEMYSL